MKNRNRNMSERQINKYCSDYDNHALTNDDWLRMTPAMRKIIRRRPKRG